MVHLSESWTNAFLGDWNFSSLKFDWDLRFLSLRISTWNLRIGPRVRSNRLMLRLWIYEHNWSYNSSRLSVWRRRISSWMKIWLKWQSMRRMLWRNSGCMLKSRWQESFRRVPRRMDSWKIGVKYEKMGFSWFLNSDLEDEEGEEVIYVLPQYVYKVSSSATSYARFW